MGHGPESPRLAPTALVMAYLRGFSDLPFAAEIARAAGAEEATRRFLAAGGEALEDQVRYAPFAEARFLCLAHAVRRAGARQVLELGSGLSFRGLALADLRGMRHVETDLPAVNHEKRRLLDAVPGLRAATENAGITLLDLDALAPDALVAMEAHFDPSLPLAVVTEGLLAYLTREERAEVARGVAGLLRRHGGWWFTPDLATREARAQHATRDSQLKRTTAAVREATKRDFDELSFADDADRREFFRALGFAIRTSPQLDDAFELSSLRRLGLPAYHLVPFAPEMWTLTLC